MLMRLACVGFDGPDSVGLLEISWEVAIQTMTLLMELLYRNNLGRQHFNIGDDHSCLLCQSEPLERNKHMCTFSSACWQSININWDTTMQTRDMFDLAAHSWDKPLFKEITILAYWNIWEQRNRLCFERIPVSLQDWRRALRLLTELSI